MNSTAIVVFANRAHRERKRFGLGARADVRLASFMVERTIATARSCSDVADVIVADDRVQRGETFEERLMGVLEDVRDRGYARVVLIGADTVTMTASDLRRAVCASEPVVGPSHDGGFYLLGIDCARLHVLRGLAWQTADVGAQLMRRLSSYEELARRHDLDGAEDARRLIELLRGAFRDFCGVELDNKPLGLPPDADRVWTPTEVLTTHPERPRGPPVLLG